MITPLLIAVLSHSSVPARIDLDAAVQERRVPKGPGRDLTPAQKSDFVKRGKKTLPADSEGKLVTFDIGHLASDEVHATLFIVNGPPGEPGETQILGMPFPCVYVSAPRGTYNIQLDFTPQPKKASYLVVFYTAGPMGNVFYGPSTNFRTGGWGRSGRGVRQSSLPVFVTVPAKSESPGGYGFSFCSGPVVQTDAFVAQNGIYFKKITVQRIND